MKALKDSLRVPARMGWNGDPCAPTTWNAWEGVLCRTSKDGNALVISQMYDTPLRMTLYRFLCHHTPFSCVGSRVSLKLSIALVVTLGARV